MPQLEELTEQSLLFADVEELLPFLADDLDRAALLQAVHEAGWDVEKLINALVEKGYRSLPTSALEFFADDEHFPEELTIFIDTTDDPISLNRAIDTEILAAVIASIVKEESEALAGFIE